MSPNESIDANGRKSEIDQIASHDAKQLANYLAGVERALGHYGDLFDPDRKFEGQLVQQIDAVRRAARQCQVFIEANRRDLKAHE